MREKFRKLLQKRFSLRLHMALILAAVFCSGVLASKLLLLCQVKSMLIRYPLAVVISYAAFFVFVKLWLLYLSSFSSRKSALRSDSVSLPDISFDLPGSGSVSSGGPSFGGGGGGSFSGAGASSSFDSPSFSGFSGDSGGGSGGGLIDGAGDAISGFFDGDDAWILIVLVALAAVVFGTGAYLIYQAPVILSDAAFQAILSTSLIRSMKKMSDPDWMKGVFRTTVFPFVVVLIVSVAAAWIGHRAYPQATKMSDVVWHIISR